MGPKERQHIDRALEARHQSDFNQRALAAVRQTPGPLGAGIASADASIPGSVEYNFEVALLDHVEAIQAPLAKLQTAVAAFRVWVTTGR
jgi:hypothetical protein